MKAATWIKSAWLIALSGACGPANESNRGADATIAAFSHRDSAGIVIAVTVRQPAAEPLNWHIDTVLNLQIGASGDPVQGGSAQPWYAFHRTGGVRQLTDGRIIVADGGSREVRFFDSAGEFLHSVGRQGRGPGEFEGGPAIVPAFRSDSLLIFDSQPVRFHLLSTDDGGHRFVRPETWKGATPPVGYVDPNVFTGAMHLTKPTTTGFYEIPLTYDWANILTGERIHVDSLVIRPQYFVDFVNNVAVGALVPFSPMPSAAVARSSAFITEGSLPEIKEYDLDGQLRRLIRIDEPLRSVTDADVDRYAEVMERPLNPDIPVPETMPTFESLLVDDEGWLWAKRYEYDPVRRPTWVVFDPSGRANGSVQTPVGLHIDQIGSDFILGVWTDELDVEHIRRYRLSGRSGER